MRTPIISETGSKDYCCMVFDVERSNVGTRSSITDSKRTCFSPSSGR